MCQFTYYKDEEKDTFYPQLYCRISNKYCLYRKKCEQQGKFILIDGESWKDCYIMNDYLFKKDAPKGAYKVVTHNVRKNGKVVLYVRLDENTTIKVDNNSDIIPSYVFLEKVGDEYKIVSEHKKEEPKVEQKKEPTVAKKNYNKKKSNE